MAPELIIFELAVDRLITDSRTVTDQLVKATLSHSNASSNSRIASKININLLKGC